MSDYYSSFTVPQNNEDFVLSGRYEIRLIKIYTHSKNDRLGIMFIAI